MRRSVTLLIMALSLSSALGAQAQPLPEDVYVPAHWCAHRFDPATTQRTEVCRFDLDSGERIFNFDMIGGMGSFRIEAAFEDGVVFFEADCVRDSENSGCEGGGWYAEGRGVTGSRWSGLWAGPLALLRQGVTALMPAGGSLTVWANRGSAASLIVRAD